MTKRDEEIVTALSLKVRYFSLEQIAREWWPGSPQAIRVARKRMLRLKGDGWLTHVRVLARPLLALEQPVLQWTLTDATPDFAAVSRRLRGRWKMPAREIELFLGTAKARAVLGGKVPDRVKNLCQTTHDLHVAEIYLHYRRKSPTVVETWIGEDEIACQEKGGAVPDAYFRHAGGSVHRAIEFGGAYSASRVSDFHTFCVTQQIPYEMW